MTDFTGWRVVATGAGSGMGAAAARRFAREGAQVVVSDIDGEAAAKVAGEIGTSALGVRCDVSSAADCAALLQAAEEFFGGPIDVFLANAGVSYAGNFLDADPQVLQRVVEAFGDKVFYTVIKRTVKFPETTVAGEPITTYASASPGAAAYRLLAREVLVRCPDA